MTDADGQANIARIVDALVYIQTHLDEDLSLPRLAKRTAISPFHFHRVFQTCVGETLKRYVQRLRVERAAFRLLCREATILDIALDVGFQSHETFTRAFKRQLGITPSSYRREVGPARHRHRPDTREILNRYTGQVHLSRTRVERWRSFQVAFLRHLGPYEDVDVDLFTQLQTWADRRGLGGEGLVLLGIGHDSPAITPPDKLRFDACIRVPPGTVGEGAIGIQTVDGGHFAITTYTGPYGESMSATYPRLFARAAAMKRYDIVGLPLIEIYRTTHIRPHYALNHTEVAIPMKPRLA